MYTDDRVADDISPQADIAHTGQDGVLVTSVTGEVDHGSVEVISAELNTRLEPGRLWSPCKACSSSARWA